MIKNYFKIAWRNLVKNRMHSFINIAGLSVGMAVAILIGLWIWDELSFDKYHQNYGRIVSASSNVAIRGNFGQTNYVATKSAIIGMTKVWAMELGRYNITVNCIAPGFITTAMTDAMPEEVKRQSIPHIPLGKWGMPDDIANGYLYLASDEASFVSGICLTIDGGAAR